MTHASGDDAPVTGTGMPLGAPPRAEAAPLTEPAGYAAPVGYAAPAPTGPAALTVPVGYAPPAPAPPTAAAPPSATPPPATVAAARAVVAALLEAYGLPGEGRTVTDALLVTSELVTNAIRHGGGLAAFHAEVHDGALRVVVADRTPELPASRSGDPALGHQIGGYGWPLIRSIADEVTVTPHAAGKHITATLRLT
ncbi:ATP-binding protein [Streptomyces subrutilus]|uniref:ATP-binding protein n=1 Tax=Streptomyces subrutilus TaxID=36818 RepID=UPI0033E8923B